jgi:hypothetical protein
MVSELMVNALAPRRSPARLSKRTGLSAGAEHPFLRRYDHHADPSASAPDRRISHVSTIPSVTTRDRGGRHRAVRDAATAQVTVTADQDSARAVKVAAVLIKRRRTVLTERCRYITR